MGIVLDVGEVVRLELKRGGPSGLVGVPCYEVNTMRQVIYLPDNSLVTVIIRDHRKECFTCMTHKGIFDVPRLFLERVS